MANPAGILRNMAIGRFHPIVFRQAPMPGGHDLDGSAQRYKSLGHHTEGFDSLKGARQWLKASDNAIDMGFEGEWDGEDVPAMTLYFSSTDIAVAIAAQQTNRRKRTWAST